MITIKSPVLTSDPRKLEASKLVGPAQVRKLAQGMAPRVGTVIGMHLPELPAQIAARCHFYKSSPLVRDAIVKLSEVRGDLNDAVVEIDRRMIDYCVGLETEFGEMVEGGNLYTPAVSLDSVVLNKGILQTILDTVENYREFQRMRQRVGLEDVLAYGKGLMLLFYGASGTGKVRV